MKRFWPYFALLKPVRGAFLLALLTGAVFGLTSGFGLAWLLNLLLPIVFDESQSLGVAERLLLVSLIPLAMSIRGVSGYANKVLTTYCGLKILEELRRRMFAKLQRLELAFFQQRESGDLMSRVMVDTEQLQQLIVRVSNDILVQPVTLLGAFGFLVWQSWANEDVLYVLLFTAITPLCVWPLRKLTQRLRKRARQVQDQAGVINEFVRENLAAAREVRAYDLGPKHEERFGVAVAHFLGLRLKVVKYLAAISPAIEVIGAVGVALAIFYASYAGIGWEEVTPLVMAIYFCYDPVKKLGVVAGLLKQIAAILDRLEEVLDLDVRLVDKPGAPDLQVSDGSIRFDHVSFAYAEAPVLHDLDLTLEGGKTYALVGPSGAGKSTFANLVIRFYDPVAGRIRIDGQDLREANLASVRRAVALVPQDPVLFDTTLAENLRVARPGASDAALEEAARQAWAHDFIAALTDGYQHRAGDRGAHLSGGQRQRLALARAILQDAPILILDEATSALDAESERRIREALERIRVGRTVLIIAHRFSTVRLADEILVFSEGRIAARGTHDDLLAREPLYNALWQAQTGDTNA